MDWSWIAQSVFSGVEWVDPQEITTFAWFVQQWREILPQLRENFRSHVSSAYPVLRGELIILFLIALTATWYCLFKTEKMKHFGEKFIVLFELGVEKIYEFFEEIIGKDQKFWVKSTVIGIFFVILFSNLAGSIFDFINTMFPGFDQKIVAPTSGLNFNISMALVSVCLILILQIQKLGFGKFIYSYLPVWWKDYVKVEKGDMHPALFYPLAVVVKLFDIVISLFVGILDIVGNIAKVISLSFRLTGNLMSGTILLGLLVWAVNLLSQFLGGVDCPVLFPIIVVLWGILGAVIQAFVFSLLTAIFIKVAVED